MTGQIHWFKRSSKLNIPTPNTGATVSRPIVEGFMYIAMSGINCDRNLFVSFPKTDIQIGNISYFLTEIQLMVITMR